ncbi:MAG TPA: hypothetical protein VMW17_07665 [Candidatus Binatia bacterium]|nr:hypothetical protein [Candidatus Binatia bacterium]
MHAATRRKDRRLERYDSDRLLKAKRPVANVNLLEFALVFHLAAQLVIDSR